MLLNSVRVVGNANSANYTIIYAKSDKYMTMTNKSIRDYINLIENAQREAVPEGKANLEKALDTLSGSWSHWIKDKTTDPNIESYWYDDGEGNYYASGRIEHDLRTGKITVDFEGEEGEEVKGTFDSVGAAMNALRGGYPGSHGSGKAPNFDTLGGREFSASDDLYKTDRAGKKGTLTKARMDTMKASSPYRMRGGPKGVLPEEQLEETSPEAIAKINQITRR